MSIELLSFVQDAEDMNGISLSLLPYSATVAPYITVSVAPSAWPAAVKPEFQPGAAVQIKAGLWYCS